MTLLVGAGVSVDAPSSIPAATRLMDVLCEWITNGDPVLRRQIHDLRRPAASRTPYVGPFASLRFELLLDWLVYFRPRILEPIEAVQLGGNPNDWHLLIANAVAAGTRVVTTNFDTRIEEACRSAGINCSTAVISDVVPSAASLENSHLIKLHGTFGTIHGPAGVPAGTLQQIARWGLGFEDMGRKRRAIERALSRETLVVAGYSASDSFDVLPILEKLDRRTRVIWFDWRAHGQFKVEHGLSASDSSLWTSHASAVDHFISHRAQAASGPIWRVQGSNERFLLELSRALKLRRRGLRPSRDPRYPAGKTPIDHFKQHLVSHVEPLTRMQSRALVASLSAAYGNERVRDIQTNLKRSPKRFPGQSRVLAALNRGDIASATVGFVAEIERLEEKGDLQTYAEDMLWILEKMFWKALHHGQRRVAASILGRLHREARRRRVLWALVLNKYLTGTLLHSLGYRSRSPARRKVLKRQSRRYLWDAMKYAVRVPRLDIAADSARLLLYLEPDPRVQRHLSESMRLWAPSLQVGETQFLVLFDLLRRHVRTGQVAPPGELLDEVVRAGRTLHSVPQAPAYLAIARAYASIYEPVVVFDGAVRRIDRAIRRTDVMFRKELMIERRALEAEAPVLRKRIAFGIAKVKAKSEAAD